MNNVKFALNNTIPITLFNKGKAGKIFDEVKNKGPKIVFKNNEPECVLISPEEYVKIMDTLEDLELLAESYKRLETFDQSKLVSQEEVDKEFGFDQLDLDDVDGIEFE